MKINWKLALEVLHKGQQEIGMPIMKNKYRLEGDKCFIELTQGKETIIDVEDMELVGKYRWYTQKLGNTYYAKVNFQKNNQWFYIFMHRLIMSLSSEDEQQIDHINHNSLDNRKQNLRFCTKQQNQQNKRKTRGKSKYKGVTWCKRSKKWVAQLKNNKKHKHLGYFDSEKKAAKAYDAVIRNYFGEFACLNFKEK